MHNRKKMNEQKIYQGTTHIWTNTQMNGQKDEHTTTMVEHRWRNTNAERTYTKWTNNTYRRTHMMNEQKKYERTNNILTNIKYERTEMMSEQNSTNEHKWWKTKLMNEQNMNEHTTYERTKTYERATK